MNEMSNSLLPSSISFEDASSSCAIDALTILCKKASMKIDLSRFDQEEINDLFELIIQGDASTSDLDKVSNPSSLWSALVRVGQAIQLHNYFNIDEQFYVNLPVHTSRFLGALISTFEVILETSADSIDLLISDISSIFIHEDVRRSDDFMVQLLKEYKDLYPYSYMFCRRCGKYPKSSFDTINKYFKSRTNLRSASGESEDDTMFRDEGDDDTLGDSFPSETFPDILAPTIIPLKPFASNPYSDDLSSQRDGGGREYNDAVQNESGGSLSPSDPRQTRDMAFSPGEASILDSYYNSWGGPQPLEEDEDSDRDQQYYIPKAAPKRQTRMKQGRKKRGTKKTGRSKSTTEITPFQDDYGESKERNPIKSVTFAEDSFSYTQSTASRGDLQSNSFDEIDEIEEISLGENTAGNEVKAFDAEDLDDSIEMLVDSSKDDKNQDIRQVKPVSSASAASSASSANYREEEEVELSLNRNSASSDRKRVSNSFDSDESSLELSDSERKESKKMDIKKKLQIAAEIGGVGGRRAGQRSVLSDDESEEEISAAAVIKGDMKPRVSNRSSWDTWAAGGVSSFDTNDYIKTGVSSRYRNPLDASLEEEDLRSNLSSNETAANVPSITKPFHKENVEKLSSSGPLAPSASTAAAQTTSQTTSSSHVSDSPESSGDAKSKLREKIQRYKELKATQQEAVNTSPTMQGTTSSSKDFAEDSKVFEPVYITRNFSLTSAAGDRLDILRKPSPPKDRLDSQQSQPLRLSDQNFLPNKTDNNISPIPKDTNSQQHFPLISSWDSIAINSRRDADDAVLNIQESRDYIVGSSSVFGDPFLTLPQTLPLPELSELAIESGVIIEGFLNKKSSSLLQQWQKRYFILRESSRFFCELVIYGRACESSWGIVPLQLKATIPIADIAFIEASGNKNTQGREFTINFVPKITSKSSGLSSLFRLSGGGSSKTALTQGNLRANNSTNNSIAGSVINDEVQSVDNGSDAGSVVSDSYYGGEVKQISLQAESSDLRLIWVSMLKRALRAAQEAAAE